MSGSTRERSEGWRAELRAALAMHDLAISGYRMLGRREDMDAIETARLAAVAAIEGVPEAEVDDEIVAYRKERGDA